MKFRKLMLSIIVIFTLGFVFCFFIYPTIKDDKKILVPNIEGLTLDEGKTKLNELEINYNIVYIEGNKEDIISHTVPSYNTLILKNKVIDIYVTKIKEEEIIDFRYMAYEDIESYINYYIDLGIKININYEINNQYDENIILKQDIITGSINNIDEINLTLSKSDLKVTIPSFIGSNINEAYLFCKDNGLTIDTIYVNSIFIKDTIIYQSIEEFEVLYKNSHDEILFYISK